MHFMFSISGGAYSGTYENNSDDECGSSGSD
jgi:hypothetical protein